MHKMQVFVETHTEKVERLLRIGRGKAIFKDQRKLIYSRGFWDSGDSTQAIGALSANGFCGPCSKPCSKIRLLCPGHVFRQMGLSPARGERHHPGRVVRKM